MHVRLCGGLRHAQFELIRRDCTQLSHAARAGAGAGLDDFGTNSPRLVDAESLTRAKPLCLQDPEPKPRGGPRAQVALPTRSHTAPAPALTSFSHPGPDRPLFL
jgi:hypothetical protein